MKFRKKPVVIDAWQFNGDVSQQPSWLAEAITEGSVWVGTPPETLLIKTLEGAMHASLGDWIIQGVKGELYPCKPDIFKATYEPAE